MDEGCGGGALYTAGEEGSREAAVGVRGAHWGAQGFKCRERGQGHCWLWGTRWAV